MVPPWTQVAVPVRLAWTTYERVANKTDWVLDTKQLSQGVIVARSLLPEIGIKAFFHAINLSDQTRPLSSRLRMGGAELAVVVNSGSPSANPATPCCWPRKPRQDLPHPATCGCTCWVCTGQLQSCSASH